MQESSPVEQEAAGAEPEDWQAVEPRAHWHAPPTRRQLVQQGNPTCSTLQRNLTLVIPRTERELRGLSPNFHIHVSVSDLHIPTFGPPIFHVLTGTLHLHADNWYNKVNERAPHCKEIWIYLFPERELAASVPMSTFMCLWTICIFPRSAHVFSCRRICRPIRGLYKSLTDTWM